MCKNTKKNILKNINFELSNNSFLFILGNNGSGKTTILKSIINSINYEGDILLDNENMKNINLKEKCKKISYLSQKNNFNFNFNCYDFISLGRYPYVKNFSKSLNLKDREIVDFYFKKLNIEKHKNKYLNQLSGGELQKIFIAKCLVQETDIIILDEPSTYLDIKYQFELFETLKIWCKEKNNIVICVSHDIIQALNYSTNILLIKNGIKIDFGETKKVFNLKNFTETFEFDVKKYFDFMNLF